jgi:hypothetical protein
VISHRGKPRIVLKAATVIAATGIEVEMVNPPANPGRYWLPRTACRKERQGCPISR